MKRDKKNRKKKQQKTFSDLSGYIETVSDREHMVVISLPANPAPAMFNFHERHVMRS